MARKKIPVLVLDAETDPFDGEIIPEPFAWGIWDGSRFVSFWGQDSTRDLIEYLRTLPRCIVYAHNGGKFDFMFLVEYLDRGDVFIIGGRISRATIGNVELRDSWNILPVPLASYEKTEIDYDKFIPERREQHRDEILSYLRDDCVYLYDLVMGFREQYGDKLTLASAAMGEIQKILKQETGGKIERMSASTDARFREYYYGGRTQCFERGHIAGPLVVYDIKSSYPYAMTFQHPHPCNPSFIVTRTLPSSEHGAWFATIRGVSRGALPHRADDGSLSFPDDDVVREYKCTGWEIMAALETGTLDIESIELVYFPVETYSYDTFVRKYAALKDRAEQEGDKRSRLIYKLVMNSGYGKFALDPMKYCEYVLCEYGSSPGPEYELIASYREYDTDVRRCPTPDDAGFINVAIAASITGFARAYLWRTVCASEFPVYCDTDSLLCRKIVAPTGDALGQWALEHNVNDAYVAGKKLYCLDIGDAFKVRSKGARLMPWQVQRLACIGGEIDYHPNAPTFSLLRGTRFIDRIIRPT